MKSINSYKSFKTSYIAEVKEEMGLLKKKKVLKERKIRTPKHVKPYIKKAIKKLADTKENFTYKKVQEEALKIYKESQENEIKKYFGILKVNDTSLVKKIAEDEGTFYGEIT